MADQDCAAFLEARYGERARGGEFLGKGEWSSAYAFDLDGEPMVLRLGAYVEDFEKDRLMSHLTGGRRRPGAGAARPPRPGLPIPEVVEIGPVGGGAVGSGPGEGGAVGSGPGEGGYFAVSRRAYGDFLDELSGARMADALPSLLETLRTLRSLNPRGPGYGGWDASGSAPFETWSAALLSVTTDEPGARVSGWRQRLAGSETGIEPFEAGVEALRSLAASLPGDIPRRLIHSDLLNRNVLVRDGEVTAVFDWANAMYGDGLYDLAWLTYWWPWYPDWRDLDIHAAIAPDLANMGPPAEVERRLLCCQIQIGLDHQKYNAFTGNWAEVERNTRRTADLLRSAGN